MPSKKKKSKTKGRKAVVVSKDGDEQKQRALDSQMQRLKIDEQQADEDEEALLEEAIKLAAAEKKDIEEKERANCKHGYNPSPSQERFCGDFMKEFMISYDSNETDCNRTVLVQLNSFADTKEKFEEDIFFSNAGCIKSYLLACGTKNIIDADYDTARFNATCTQVFSSIMSFNENFDHKKLPKLVELQVADEHTLVQFYRKQIPCSCLDERHEEVKSIPKLGYCSNDDCPLPHKTAVRSKMVYCVRCRVVNYCSRECQVAAWSKHKQVCCK